MLLACRDPVEKTAVSPVDTAPWAPEAATPVWDLSQATEAIQQTLLLGIPEPRTILLAYQQLLDQEGSDTCPGPEYTFTQPFEGCISETGYQFAGNASYQSMEGNGFLLHGDCTITSPEGIVFQCGGQISWFYSSSGPVQAESTGTWGAANLDGWLGEIPGMALWVDGDAQGMQMDGGYTLGQTALYFDTFYSTASCITSGSIRIRDSAGVWYSLDFADTCDGCGTLYQGENSAPACINIQQPLLDLENRLRGG